MSLFKRVKDSMQRSFLVPVGLAAFDGSLLVVKAGEKKFYLKFEDLDNIVGNSSLSIPVYEMRVRTEQGSENHE